MKKIYIDGLGLVEGHFSGIGQYILGVLQGIDQQIEAEILAGGKPLKIKVIIPKDTVSRFKSFGFKHIGYKTLPLSFRYVAALWHRGKMFPLDLWCGRGVYIFPRFVDMPLLFSKSALVIYDISFELFREFSDEKNAKFLSNGIKRSLKRTSKVITISQNARREIIDFYHVDPDMVVVATPAVDTRHFYRRSSDDIEAVKRKYGIRGDYILALSNLEPRKNLDGLVDAYCMLPKALTDKIGLLLVGVNGWKTEALFDKIITKVASGYNIQRPSKYVSDSDKPAIISGAKLLAYPSHYEGFGMPPLEALACGVPVITSDNSSLPEVVGRIGAMVPSTDTAALADMIAAKLTKPQKNILNDGPDQALKFSWKESGKIFLNVIEEIG